MIETNDGQDLLVYTTIQVLPQICLQPPQSGRAEVATFLLRRRIIFPAFHCMQILKGKNNIAQQRIASSNPLPEI